MNGRGQSALSDELVAAISEVVNERDDDPISSHWFKWDEMSRWIVQWADYDWVIFEADGTIYETFSPAGADAKENDPF